VAVGPVEIPPATTLRNYEAGLKGSIAGARISYALSAFRIDQEDRLIFVSNPDAFFGSGLPDTIATTGQRYETRGIELTTRVRPHAGTNIDVNYGWLDATWAELLVDSVSGTLDLSGTTPTGVPAHVFSVGIDQSLHERVSLRLGVEAYSDYFVTQNNALKGGAYQLVNLGLTWRPAAWRLDQINLAVTNLLDREYYYCLARTIGPHWPSPGCRCSSACQPTGGSRVPASPLDDGVIAPLAPGVGAQHHHTRGRFATTAQ
jgi:iron complex outermembrane receptor protein